VILDEIGRGTSTFDGPFPSPGASRILHEQDQARTLFATHYHELTKLAEERKGVFAIFNVAVREWNDQIIFLAQNYSRRRRQKLWHPSRPSGRFTKGDSRPSEGDSFALGETGWHNRAIAKPPKPIGKKHRPKWKSRSWIYCETDCCP